MPTEPTPSTSALARDFLARLSALAMSIPWSNTGPSRPRFEIDSYGDRVVVRMAPAMLATVVTVTFKADGTASWSYPTGCNVDLDLSDMDAAARLFYGRGQIENPRCIAALPDAA